jgi:hypothetical protein
LKERGAGDAIKKDEKGIPRFLNILLFNKRIYMGSQSKGRATTEV